MKKQILILLCFILGLSYSYSQTKNKLLQEFKNNYPMYSMTAKMLLVNMKADSTLMEFMDRGLPSLINEDYRGMTQQFANYAYRKKKIKAINPKFLGYMEMQFQGLVMQITTKNYAMLAFSLGNIGITADNYLNKNILPFDIGIVPDTMAVTMVADTTVN
jgi:hypothetical protein